MDIQYRKNRKRRKFFELSCGVENPLDLYDHLPFQIAVCSNLLQLNKDIDIKQVIDLDPRELRVILNIGSYGPITGANISYQSRLDAYTITRAVKKLASLKLIEKTVCLDNKKIKLFQLTANGKDIYQRLITEITKRDRVLDQSLSLEEKETLLALLSKVEDQAERMLADKAKSRVSKGQEIPADQKEIIRWFKKSSI